MAESTPLHDRPTVRTSPVRRRFARLVFVVALAFVGAGLGALLAPGTAIAAGAAPAALLPAARPAVAPTPPEVPELPEVSDPFDRPTGNTGSPGVDEGDSSDASIDVNFPNVTEESSNSVVIILLLTLVQWQAQKYWVHYEVDKK